MEDADASIQIPTKRCTNKACAGFTEPLPLDQFRRTKDGKPVSNCRRCESQRTRDYNKRFPERVRASMATWYAKNREQIRQRRKAFYQQNCARLRQESRLWYQSHQEHVNQYRIIYRLKHPEQFIQQHKMYYVNHYDAERKRMSAWQKANPDKVVALSHRRRARIKGAPINDFTAGQWRAIKAHYQHRCAYCGKKPKRLTMDHITPIAKGGNHTVSNIIPACQSCNSRKHTGKPPVPVQPVLFA